MKAIVIAAMDMADAQSGIRNDLPCFLPVMDKPFIQHIIEYLAGQKIQRFDFIISSYPERIRRFLEDGSRWGVQIDYQVVKDSVRPYERLRFLSFDQPMLLVHADRLVWIDVQSDRLKQPPDCTCLFMTPSSDSETNGKWTGWGWISSTDCLAVPHDMNEEDFFQWLSNRPNIQFRIVEQEMLSVQTFSAMLQSHWRVFDNGFLELMVAGTEIEPGIWLSRNVILHPLSRIEPPVFIGQNSQILKGVQLGPYAVVGENCIVDERCIVTSSVICSGSYVGQSLEIVEAVVDKNCLINTRLNSTLTLSENFLLGPLGRDKRIRLNLFSRLFAAVFLSCLWPIIMATVIYLRFFRHGPVVFGKKCVKLPADLERSRMKLFLLRSFCPPGSEHLSITPSADRFGRMCCPPCVEWRDFFLRFLPGLFSVISGNLWLVGLTPRSIFEIEAMPKEWRLLYSQGRTGLITDSMVTFGPQASMDECQASETIYAAASGWCDDIKIFFQYFGQMLGLIPKPGSV